MLNQVPRGTKLHHLSVIEYQNPSTKSVLVFISHARLMTWTRSRTRTRTSDWNSLVQFDNGQKTMSDDQHLGILEVRPEDILDSLISRVVEIGCRFVHYQKGRVA